MLDQLPSGPRISAVINYYNPKGFSRIEATVTLCMEALKEFSHYPVEVICSDGGGVESRNIKAVCERLGCIYTISPVPQNYAAIYNHGLRMATGDYIAVVENDVFVHQEWDKKMIGEMQRTGASLAVPFITNCDVIVQVNGFVIKRQTFEPTCISQNLMLFDREAYRIAFPMDEQFNGAFNDTDTYLRLRAAGKRMIVCDGGGIVHYRRSSHIYNMFTYQADVDKFKAKYPDPRLWTPHGAYNLEVFANNPAYRALLKLCSMFPSRLAGITTHYAQRFESVFQKV